MREAGTRRRNVLLRDERRGEGEGNGELRGDDGPSSHRGRPSHSADDHNNTI